MRGLRQDINQMAEREMKRGRQTEGRKEERNKNLIESMIEIVHYLCTNLRFSYLYCVVVLNIKSVI